MDNGTGQKEKLREEGRKETYLTRMQNGTVTNSVSDLLASGFSFQWNLCRYTTRNALQSMRKCFMWRDIILLLSLSLFLYFHLSLGKNFTNLFFFLSYKYIFEFQKVSTFSKKNTFFVSKESNLNKLLIIFTEELLFTK